MMPPSQQIIWLPVTLLTAAALTSSCATLVRKDAPPSVATVIAILNEAETEIQKVVASDRFVPVGMSGVRTVDEKIDKLIRIAELKALAEDSDGARDSVARTYLIAEQEGVPDVSLAGIARVQAKMGDPEAALRTLKRIGASHDRFWPAITVAEIFGERGNRAAAVECLYFSREAADGDDYKTAQIAVAFATLGQIGLAQELIRDGKLFGSVKMMVLGELARAHIRGGDQASAVGLADHLVDPLERTEFFSQIAPALAARDRPLALELLGQAESSLTGAESADGFKKGLVWAGVVGARAKIGDFEGALRMASSTPESSAKIRALSSLIDQALDRPDVQKKALTLDESLDERSQAALHFNIFQAHVFNENWNAALDMVSELRSADLYSSSMKSIVELARKADRAEKARRLVDSARDAILASGQTWRLDDLAADYIRLDDREEAWRLAASVEPRMRIILVEAIVRVLSELGQFGDAIEMTTQIDNVQRQIVALGQIAVEQASKGKVEDAESTFGIARQLLRANRGYAPPSPGEAWIDISSRLTYDQAVAGWALGAFLKGRVASVGLDETLQAARRARLPFIRGGALIGVAEGLLESLGVREAPIPILVERGIS